MNILKLQGSMLCSQKLRKIFRKLTEFQKRWSTLCFKKMKRKKWIFLWRERDNCREVESFVVSQTQGIQRCIEREEIKDGQPVLYLQTQGVNLEVLIDSRRVVKFTGRRVQTGPSQFNDCLSESFYKLRVIRIIRKLL